MKLNIVVCVLLMCSACTWEKNEEDILLGNWKVQWTDNSIPGNDTESYSCHVMNGEISFSSDGKAILKGYGHEGCVFMQDTTSQVVNWDLNANQINLSDNDRFFLAYEIIAMNSRQVECKILNDIAVKFSKN